MARPKGSKDTEKRKRRIPLKSLMSIGQRFDRLLVINLLEDYEKYDTHQRIMVRVRCDCGKEFDKNLYDLKYRNVSSCGCFHRAEMSKRQIKPNNHAAKMRLYNNYKSSAINRGLEFELTFDEVFELCDNKCYYCEKPQSNIITTVGGTILVNGIDRVDNKIGYNKKNCVPCCSDCNYLKRDVSKNIIEKAYEFFKNT